MTTTETFDITLRLNWGPNGDRDIEVPIEYRKGSYSGRYELYLDDTHVGWVVRSGSEWHAYISGSQRGLGELAESKLIALGRTRREAVAEIVYKLTHHARTNALATRAIAAYAEPVPEKTIA